ncbi:MAG: mannitol dehydrogenase family protein [Microbacterium sp.]
MEKLSRTSLPSGARHGAPAPEETGIVHLGLGNFHRAHAAEYTARALAAEPGEWGIAGFANRSTTVVDAMRAQDGMYSVLELSEEGRRAHVVDVHRDFGVLAQDPGAFARSVADARHRILTITVSEFGYHRSAATGRLDVDSPEIARDIADPDAAATPVGLIAKGLRLRAEHGEPFSVLSCDNLPSAGRTTREVVVDFLRASGAGSDVLDYVDARVAFPNAMVDRIVPATTPETATAVADLLGVRDAAPVRAERFSMWVIEDDFPGGRPAWGAAGATFSDEVEAYELVKLRLLNGSHSLIAYLGALDGRETIPSSFGEDFVREAVLRQIRHDMLPGIALPRGFDAEAYTASLTHRWSNTELGDLTSRVGSLGSARLVQRVPEAAGFLLDSGRMPHLLALTTASWIAALVPPEGFDPGPIASRMDDPASERILAQTRGATDVREHVRRIFDGGWLTDGLAARTAFVERVAELVGAIAAHGVRAAAADAVAASDSEQGERR